MNIKPLRLLLSLFILAPLGIGRAGLAASPGATLSANPLLQVQAPEALPTAHPGDLDATFGEGGKRITAVRVGNLAPLGAILLPDSKIAVATRTDNPDGRQDFLLARFNFDGSPDLAFGSAGQVLVDFDGMNDWASALAVQKDGRLLISGGSSNMDLSSPVWGEHFAMARCLPDGRLDPSLGEGGRVWVNFGVGTKGADRIAVLDDGRILAAGQAQVDSITYQIAIARLLGDGRLDPAFGESGKVLVDFGSYTAPSISLLLPLPNGGFLIAGSYVTKFHSIHGFYVRRFLANGEIDGSFGQNGRVLIEDIGEEDHFQTFVGLPDGKLLAIGYTYASPNYLLLMLRLNPDGSLDPTFGLGGRLADPQPGFGPASGGVQLQPDGKILVGGSTSVVDGSDFAVRRYLPDGSRDASFGSEGWVTTNLMRNDSALLLLTDAAGRFLVAGRSYADPNFYLLTMARFWYEPPVNDFTTWFPVVGK